MNISLNNFSNGGIKVRRAKFGVGSLIFLLLFGALFAGVGFSFLKSSQIDKSWVKMDGKVVDVARRTGDGSTTYSPIVSYTVDNKTYRATSTTSTSSYPAIGSTRTIAYNPSRPAQSTVEDGIGIKLMLLIFPAIGIIMLLIAPFLFIRSLNRSRKIQNLIQTGQKVQGVITDLESSGSSNNATYKIIVSATDSSGAVKNYSSDDISGFAGLAMADFQKNPIAIDVFIDPANPDSYYVDLSDIPNLTPDRISELIKTATANKR